MKSFKDLKASVVDKPTTEVIKRVSIKDGEPGDTIGIANGPMYKQVGQWCDTCENVVLHVFSKKYNKIKCLNCKTTKQL